MGRMRKVRSDDIPRIIARAWQRVHEREKAQAMRTDDEVRGIRGSALVAVQLKADAIRWEPGRG